MVMVSVIAKSMASVMNVASSRVEYFLLIFTLFTGEELLSARASREDVDSSQPFLTFRTDIIMKNIGSMGNDVRMSNYPLNIIESMGLC